MAAHLSYLLERRARTFGRTELLSEEERVAALMLSVTSQPCRCGAQSGYGYGQGEGADHRRRVRVPAVGPSCIRPAPNFLRVPRESLCTLRKSAPRPVADWLRTAPA
jgi:hypothetical protein